MEAESENFIYLNENCLIAKEVKWFNREGDFSFLTYEMPKFIYTS